MSYWRKLYFLFLLIPGALGSQIPTRGNPKMQPTPKTINSVADAVAVIRGSIVQIGLRVATPASRIPTTVVLGSGFLVSKDAHVITARHVIQQGRSVLTDVGQTLPGRSGFFVGLALENKTATEGSASLTLRNSYATTGFEIVAEDQRHDIALLKLAQNPFKGEVKVSILVAGKEPFKLTSKAAVLAPERPRDGDQIIVSGYPFGTPALVTNVGWLATSWATSLSQLQPPGAPPGFTIPDVSDVYLADITVNPGNSGGPVYSARHAGVIGVCVAHNTVPVRYGDGNREGVTLNGRPIVFNAGLAHVVPVGYVIEILKTNNVHWSEVTGPH